MRMVLNNPDFSSGSALNETVTQAPSAPEKATPDDSPQQSEAAALEQRPFQDMPQWIWKLFFASWLALFAAFVIIFGVSGNVRFVLGVVAAFATVFFVTPLVLLRLTRRGSRTQLRTPGRHVDLLYGRCSQTEAAVQIVLLPIALAVGLIVISMLVPR
jgi:hypothetical protein